MRRSSITSKVVIVALVTSIFRSGIWNNSSPARTVWLSVQRDDGKCSSLQRTRNHFLHHHHPAMSVEMVVKTPSDSPRRFPCSSPRSRWSRIKVDVLRTWSPPRNLTVPSAIGNIIFNIFWALTLPSHWVSGHRFQMRPSFCNSYMSATKMSPFRIHPAYNT